MGAMKCQQRNLSKPSVIHKKNSTQEGCVLTCERSHKINHSVSNGFSSCHVLTPQPCSLWGGGMKSEKAENDETEWWLMVMNGG